MKTITSNRLGLVILLAATIGLDSTFLDGKITNGYPPSENIKCLASLQERRGKHFCSATFFTMQYLLCAAHSIQNLNETEGYDHKKVTVFAQGVYQKVTYLVVNGNFKENIDNEPPINNIGFIAVEKPFSETILPAILPTKEDTKSIAPGSELTLLGWDAVDRYDIHHVVLDYKINNVAITYMSQCQIKFKFRENLNRCLEFCGRSTNTNIHFGEEDFGATLLRGNVLMGILSHGDPKSFGSVVLYTKVFDSLEFIHKQQLIVEERRAASSKIRAFFCLKACHGREIS